MNQICDICFLLRAVTVKPKPAVERMSESRIITTKEQTKKIECIRNDLPFFSCSNTSCMCLTEIAAKSLLMPLLINSIRIELLSAPQKQPSQVFYKKGVLQIFAKFTGKHLCQNLYFNTFIKREIFKSTFLTKHLLRTTASCSWTLREWIPSSNLLK